MDLKSKYIAKKTSTFLSLPFLVIYSHLKLCYNGFVLKLISKKLNLRSSNPSSVYNYTIHGWLLKETWSAQKKTRRFHLSCYFYNVAMPDVVRRCCVAILS